MAKFDMSGFIREYYLRSTPSVDLDNVTSENPVNCSEHKLSTDDYHAICVTTGWRTRTAIRSTMSACAAVTCGCS